MTARPAIGSSSTFPDLVVGAVSTARIIKLNDEIVMMRRRHLTEAAGPATDCVQVTTLDLSCRME
jgi:hypothetical protein